MKAIETQYGGCAFRSETQARWAVFFDALDVQWVYQTEGFGLGIPGFYLEGFHLPELSLWIEVRTDKPAPHELRRALALASLGGAAILVLHGTPRVGTAHEPGVLFAWPNNSSGGGFAESTAFAGFVVSGEGIALDISAGAADGWYCDPAKSIRLQVSRRHQIMGMYGHPTKLYRAYDAAQRAQFEREDLGLRA